MRARSHTPDGELLIALRSNASSAAGKLDNIKVVRRVIVSVVGATVVLIGIALLVLPGPAFVVIPVGLAILATEYAWARRWLRKVRRVASEVVSGRERTSIRDLVSSISRRARETRSQRRRTPTASWDAAITPGSLRTAHAKALVLPCEKV